MPETFSDIAVSRAVQDIAASLPAFRAQFERIAAALEALQAALGPVASALATIPPDPVDAPAGPCDHPEACRVDYAVPGGAPDWECSAFRGGCGFRQSPGGTS